MDTRKLSEIIYPELYTTQKLSSCYSLSNNLMLWRLKLAFVLKDYEVHHIIETPNPNANDPSWLNAEQNAKSLICSRLDPSMYYEFQKSPTCKSFLEDLEKTQKGILGQYYLCETYSRLKMEPDGDVNEHVIRMRAMAKLVGFSGVEIDEKLQSLMLLDSLPEDWDEDVERLMMEFHASKEELSFDNIGRRLRAANDFREWRNYRDSNMEGGSEARSKRVNGKTSTSNGDETFSFSYFPVSLTEMLYSSIKTRFQLNYTGSYFDHWKEQIHIVLVDNKVDYLLKDYSPSDEDASSQRKRLSHEFLVRFNPY